MRLWRGGIDTVNNLFRDNAMFYKDITQWLRNKTFTSLFFGLLLMALILCVLIILSSKDISEPGRMLFNGLYLMLMIYAVLIAYQGNSLTGREFTNRTFELFELSGMSLEGMVGGKLLSMVYQFMFGFFCLVPFMFFAYMLGGLDFFEMIVGVMLAVLLVVPVYLISLAAALTGRLKQVGMLLKLGSMVFVAFMSISMLIALFGGSSLFSDLIRGTTEMLAAVARGIFEAQLALVGCLAVYIQLCLLVFYLACDNISRENDSRETAVKILATTLVASWLGIFVIINSIHSGAGTPYDGDDWWYIVSPIYFVLLGLGLRSFYNPVEVPVIVEKRQENASFLSRLFYPIFKPGMEGGCRTILMLVLLTASVVLGVFGSFPYSSLLVQVPWFLVFPYLLVARFNDLKGNYGAQRSVAVASWVVLGIMTMMLAAWTRSDLFGSRANPAMALAAVVLSPFSSMIMTGSRDLAIQELTSMVRVVTGGAGILLMCLHTIALTRNTRTEKQVGADAAS